jgi:predicted MFS family arabinose efflux permease
MHRRWLILVVLFIARTAMGFQYQTVASVAPSLSSELHVGFAEIGTLIGLYHISGVFLSLPGGLISRRIGDKNLCAIGLALMACGGTVMSLSDSYGVAFAGRLASGMGATLFNLVLTKMTTDWFTRREIVLAMAVILSTWPFGIALGLLTEPLIAEAFGWRSMMQLAGGICLLSLLLVALFYRTPPEEHGSEPPHAVAVAQPFGLPPLRVLAPVIAAGLMWGSFNAGLVAYFSFVPTFLAESGRMRLAEAGAMTSLALWVGMISIPFGGYAVQRIGRPLATIVVFCTLAASSLALIAAGAPPLLACIVFGVAIGPPPGVITSLPARVLTSAQRASGFGIFYTCHFLLQAGGPAVAGWIHDTAGGAAAVFFGTAMFLVPLPLLAAFVFLAARSQSAAGIAVDTSARRE